eukprot:SAG22_NODE_10447_length_535_cov_0.871560_1_plen_47_part_00
MAGASPHLLIDSIWVALDGGGPNDGRRAPAVEWNIFVHFFMSLSSQ